MPSIKSHFTRLIFAFRDQDRLAESDVGVQTEREIWPPLVAPKHVPDSSGVDKSTQILPDDPDLFVFDEEVVVVLEALVGKTLEQGLLEVLGTSHEVPPWQYQCNLGNS